MTNYKYIKIQTITKFDIFKFFIFTLSERIKYKLKIPMKHNKNIVNNKKILDYFEGNELISSYIKSNKIFFISRFGSVECEIVSAIHWYEMKHRKYVISTRLFKEAKLNAGMFSNNIEGFKTFANYTKNALSQMDACGNWPLPYSDIFYKMYGKKNLQYFKLGSLFTFKVSNLWTRMLKNKKILVVSPYSETIVKQYKNRNKIFRNKETLPFFTLLTYTPVVSSGDNCVEYKTWEDALIKMKDDILKIDFDIALLSCGSYGMPLGGAFETI